MSERPATLYELCKALFSLCCLHPELKDKKVSVHTECGYSGANIEYPVRVYTHRIYNSVSILTNDDINVEEEEGYTVYKAGDTT